ncbi:hypothetical protein NDI39_29380 [Microcoleus sp. ZQ-A2]|nr:hypothetical protein [Microcoleus sp. FACHB-1]
MAQLNLRFSDPKIYENLKKKAQEEQVSLNKLAIQAIERYLKSPSSSITQVELEQHLAPIKAELAQLRQALRLS